MHACRQKRSGARRPYTQRMISLLLWPFRPPAAWILGLFILLGWLLLAAVDLFDDMVPMALIIGFELPLWYLLLGSLCLAAQMRLLHHARGLTREPMADETNLNPFGNGLAFRFFVLLAIPLGVLQWQAAAPSPAIIALLAIVFPLPWLSLMLEASAREAFRPATLWRLSKGFGIDWDGALVEKLLADFPDAYPESHLIANARFRLARLLHENGHRHDEAIAVLREIKAAHPRFAATDQFRSLVLSIRDR